ncbi:gamma-glutamylcyclotransferase family protein [Galbibacter sp. PAP.153]
MHVFVYGTLMRGFYNTFAQNLHTNATYIGKGQASGRLYDLGAFPGAVFDASADLKIKGEVYYVEKNVKSIMDSLDTYEGINDPEFDYYEKREAIILVNNTKIKALVYHLKIAVDTFTLIENGDYL